MTQKERYEAAGQQFFEELKQVRAQRDALLEACEAALDAMSRPSNEERLAAWYSNGVGAILEAAIGEAKEEAEARLIAAASDLLEAAEALAIDAESAAFILQHKHPSEYPETGKRLRHSLDAISEAIAKAREAQKGEA